MDAAAVIVNPNPRDKANIFSRLIFVWMMKVFRKALSQGLKIKDLYVIAKEDESARLGEALEQNWLRICKEAKAQNKIPSMFKAISDTFFWTYMFYGFCLFFQCLVLRTLQPIILGFLLSLFSTPENEQDSTLLPHMYITGAVLILNAWIVVFIQHHCNFGQTLIGMRVRIATSSLVYRKLLRLSKKSLGQTAAGQIVNLLSNDVSRFDFVAFALHYLWISPFQVILVTTLLWQEVGVACLAGIATVIMFTLPVQSILGKLQTLIRAKIAVRTDKRVRIMNEIIQGIQVIKMYAWEKPFELMVKFLRKEEIQSLTRSAYYRGLFLSCTVFLDRTALYVTLVTFIMTTGESLTSQLVFSSQQFFSMLQLALAMYVPLAVSIGAEALISIDRLQDFMIMEERVESNVEITKNEKISVDSVTAVWDSENDHVTLNNLNIEIPAGKLCAVVGPVGAGKSSLLQLLLGELPVKTGKISVCGEISYSSQEPWLFVSTVRDNILFGQEYDKKHYQKVAKVCALLPDFEQFPQRDRTLVGERGVSLSGGQRARINLARAVYRNADVYLMDDPLSAVDTHVGKHLFEECIMKYLKGKTRILVTHQLQYLKNADMIIVLNEGKIEAKGTFEDLAGSKFDFTKMLLAADETTEEKTREKPRISQERKVSIASVESTNSVEQDYDLAPKNEEETGLKGKSALTEYLKAAGGPCVLFLTGLVIVMVQVSCSTCDVWVSYWTHSQEEENTKSLKHYGLIDKMIDFVAPISFQLGIGVPNNVNESYPYYTYKQSQTITDVSQRVAEKIDYIDQMLRSNPIEQNVAIAIYTGIILTIITLTLIRAFTFFKITIVAAKNLHNQMFHSLLNAPMRFFDVNPSGRVLNRFSKDMGAVDEVLPRVTMEAMQIMLVMLGILVVIIIANYWMAIVIAIFAVVFILMRMWYLETVKIVKHLEGILKSPVFSHLNSSLNGISTIRASHAEVELTKEFDNHQDSHTSAWFLNVACISSFGLWIDFLCLTFTATVTFSFIIMFQLDSLGGGGGSKVGLAISQALALTGLLQHGMRQTAEVVNQMASVERILQYTVLEEEGPFESPPDKKPPNEWPQQGHIKFDHMYLKYTTYDPPVLKDLDFEVQSGHKVGIVGRTGAGKSSLISALFRLTLMDGAIIIDKIDTQSIGLHDVRKKISIIPQEPVLFSATIRYNLDPFDEYEDKALWSALEEVELKESVPSLEYLVEEGGANFSLGQRQLVCLARAILRNSKVLVLDEATANVDPKTDALIQTTIRRKFSTCTVLTIAHRLNTIMDSDMVLVMDAGRMIEYDHPHALLQKLEGHFTKMVAQTGPAMTKTLHAVAAQAYLKSFGKTLSPVDVTPALTLTEEPKKEKAMINQPIEEEEEHADKSIITTLVS